MHTISQALRYFFLRQSRSSILAIVLFMIAILGYLDYITGFELSFSIFYILPITIATWYIGKHIGYFFTFVSIATWTVSNWASGQTYIHELVRYWNAAGRLALFILIVWLLEEFKHALHHEHLLAQTDHLTGIPNSREFYFQANAELLRAGRSKQPVTIAYIDVDSFKQINDQFGHLEGDSILRVIAQSIQSSTRKTDVVARLGGDEFVLLLPNTDQNGARSIMDKIRNKLAEQIMNEISNVTFSIGVVTFGSPPASVDELLRKSDTVMYDVKAKGKNGVVFIKA